MNLERQYERVLIGLVNELRAGVRELLAQSDEAARTDALDPKDLRTFSQRMQLTNKAIAEALKTGSDVKAAVAEVNRQIQQALGPPGPKRTKKAVESAKTAAAAELDGTLLLQGITKLERQIGATMSRPKLTGLARVTASQIATFTGKQVDGQIAAIASVPTFIASRGATEAAVTTWVSNNVSLIRTIPERFFDQTRELITESVAIGRRPEVLRKMLEERVDVAGYNARRIARDQTSKLVGQVTRARQQAIGVSRFVWRSSGDERVRDSHAALDGEVFSWATGHPTEGFPGQAIQCRCTADPVIDDVLGADED